MTFLGITIEIIDYFPSNFNFENFSFIFTSESRDFEKEISFLNKNKIFQKISIQKKNLKYSIKVTKNNSLIGISELIIPSTVFSKKETSFEKLCQISMSDSIRKLLFGNILSKILKINVHCKFQYLEKGEKLVKITSSIPNINNKKEEKRTSTPKKLENNQKKLKIGTNSNTNLKLNKEEKKTMSKTLTEDFKKRSNIKSYKNNLNAGTVSVNNHNKSNCQQIKKERETSNTYHKKERKDLEEESDNISFDEDLKNPINNPPQEFINFMLNFEKKYPLEKLNDITDQNEMINYTRNIINELLDYQINYYNILTHSVNINRKFNNLLIKYNEKYRLTLKKLSKLEEENCKNDVETELTTDININESSKIKKLIPLKESELELYKEIYSINLDENEIQKYSEEQLKQIKEKNSEDNNTQLLLIKLFQNIYNKYGPLNKIVNPSNSNENEIKNIINLSEKFNLSLNEEEANDGFEYVLSHNPDETDIKLEQNLKHLYNQKKIPKLIFKKISNNNYEYGTQKVNIKIDGDIIKTKSFGGFILLDKFLENNAMLEDGKIKNNSKNFFNTTKKKKLKVK